MNMWIFWTIIIWIFAITNMYIVKKMSPETWVLYVIKAIIICLAFTFFAIIHVVG